MSEDTKDRPANEPKPAAWPVVLILLAAPLAAAVVASIAILVAVLASPSDGASFADRCKDWIPAHTGTLTGVALLVVPVQATILGIACASAGGGRLGFTRWSATGRTIALAVLGTLGVQWASATAFELLRIEPSRHLKELSRMLAVPGVGPGILVGLLVSLAPALCEEALFRGFAQRRLLERWSPAAAIGVASFFFALSHGDVQHGIMVFPLGLWFGFVAWKTGSTRASALCTARTTPSLSSSTGSGAIRRRATSRSGGPSSPRASSCARAPRWRRDRSSAPAPRASASSPAAAARSRSPRPS